MSHTSPPRVYTHYLPSSGNTGNSERYDEFRSATGVGHGVGEISIEHYLNRLNHSYRQLTGARERSCKKHAYDLYNNDDFYIRKYGDFYLTGTRHTTTDLHRPGSPATLQCNHYQHRTRESPGQATFMSRFTSPTIDVVSPTVQRDRFCDKVFFNINKNQRFFFFCILTCYFQLNFIKIVNTGL